jgi:hypothetical protein
MKSAWHWQRSGTRSITVTVLGFETFEAYCKAKWDFTGNYARKLITSAETVDNIKTGTTGTVPATERQTRPLLVLPPAQQLIAWQKVVDIAPEGKVTTAYVTKIVREMTGKTPKIKKRITLGEEVTPAFKETCRLPCHDNRFTMNQGRHPSTSAGVIRTESGIDHQDRPGRPELVDRRRHWSEPAPGR